MEIANHSGSWTQTRLRKSTRRKREALIGLLFLSPWLIGFIFFKALPILAALIFSFTNFKMLAPEATASSAWRTIPASWEGITRGPACSARLDIFCWRSRLR